MSDTAMTYAGPLILEEGSSGWYTIEKGEHAGVTEIRRTGPASGYLYYSGRISDACVEGPLHHMQALARAIRAGGKHTERRCAVRCEEDRVFLWSPRNSTVEAEVPMQRALELAAIIEAEVDRVGLPEVSND